MVGAPSRKNGTCEEEEEEEEVKRGYRRDGGHLVDKATSGCQ